jgi:hypothetical protein
MKFLPDLIVGGGMTAAIIEFTSQYGDVLARLFGLVSEALVLAQNTG